MSPDMRRLALAVAKVRWHDPEMRDEDWTDEALANFECEEIARAVLKELREVSGAMSTAAYSIEYPGEPAAFSEQMAAVVDAILADPASA